MRQIASGFSCVSCCSCEVVHPRISRLTAVEYRRWYISMSAPAARCTSADAAVLVQVLTTLPMHVGATATSCSCSTATPPHPTGVLCRRRRGGCVVCHFNHLGQHKLLPAMWQPVVALSCCTPASATCIARVPHPPPHACSGGGRVHCPLELTW